MVAQGGGQGADDVLEAEHGVVDGELELLHLPGVLDQAQFGQHGGEEAVGVDERGGAGAAGGGVELGVDAGEHPGGGLRAGEQLVQLVEVLDAHAGEPGGLVEVGAAADPELAVAAVAEELGAAHRVGAAAGGAGPQVEDGLVAVGAGRLQDEHMADLVLAGEAGEPGVGAVRAEAVVDVVAADLEPAGRDDQALAGEGQGQPGAAAGRDGVAGDAALGRERGGGPGGAHEGVERRRHREVVASGVEAGLTEGHRVLLKRVLRGWGRRGCTDTSR